MSDDKRIYDISPDPEVNDRKAGVEINIQEGAQPPPPAVPQRPRQIPRPQAVPSQPQQQAPPPPAAKDSDMLQIDMSKIKGFLKDNEYPEFKFLLLAAIIQTFCCCYGLSITAGIVSIIFVITVRFTHKMMSAKVWKIVRIASWVMVFGSLIISGLRFILVPFKDMATKLMGK